MNGMGWRLDGRVIKSWDTVKDDVFEEELPKVRGYVVGLITDARTWNEDGDAIKDRVLLAGERFFINNERVGSVANGEKSLTYYDKDGFVAAVVAAYRRESQLRLQVEKEATHEW
jgi:hypothetical protein